MNDAIYDNNASYNNFLSSDRDVHSTSVSFLSEEEEISALSMTSIKYKKANAFVTTLENGFFNTLYAVDDEAVKKTKELFDRY